ncbi:MAG: S1/P1 nuclease [Pyrinomonadaceae bacterium]
MKKIVVVLCSIALLPLSVFCYGPKGHALVGAIADIKLQENQKAAAKVSQLLDGLTLEKAANLADSIKGWDDCDGEGGKYFVAGGKRINEELRAFVAANACDSEFDHHQYHYTDVPVTGKEKYKDGKIGRSDKDIVHMIAYCIRVLGNKEPQPNPRAITKTVAIILLAHYLGDIHQPLHVGAEFFNAKGEPFTPSYGNKGYEDQGGNKLTLFLLVDGKARSQEKFHSYWDSKIFNAAYGETPISEIAAAMAASEPKQWKLTGNPDSLAEQMANEILPIAREAHSRLTYSKIEIDEKSSYIIRGRATEKQVAGQELYAIWSQGVVKEEINRAGWRLSAILTALFK